MYYNGIKDMSKQNITDYYLSAARFEFDQDSQALVFKTNSTNQDLRRIYR